MELNIQAKNLQLNETTRDNIARKVNRLARHLPGITWATVELAMENTRAQDQRVVAQVTLDIHGTVLRGEERGANAMAAVNSVVGVMDRRVERYKGKVYKSGQVKKTARNTSIRTLDVPPATSEGDFVDTQVVSSEGRVVKVKRFPIKPMTVEDAAFQLDLLGHDFFLFLNGETNQHNVLYRRHDGDYGLIQPEPL